MKPAKEGSAMEESMESPDVEASEPKEIGTKQAMPKPNPKMAMKKPAMKGKKKIRSISDLREAAMSMKNKMGG